MSAKKRFGGRKYEKWIQIIVIKKCGEGQDIIE